MVLHKLLVRIPGFFRTTIATAVDLYKAHPAFHQSAGEQTVPSKVSGGLLVEPVRFSHRLGFRGEISHLGSMHLHAGGQFVGCDACLQGTLGGILTGIVLVELVDQIEAGLLLFLAHPFRIGQIHDGHSFGSKGNSLVGGWHEPVRPVQVAIHRRSALI